MGEFTFTPALRKRSQQLVSLSFIIHYEDKMQIIIETKTLHHYTLLAPVSTAARRSL